MTLTTDNKCAFVEFKRESKRLFFDSEKNGICVRKLNRRANALRWKNESERVNPSSSWQRERVIMKSNCL